MAIYFQDPDQVSKEMENIGSAFREEESALA